MGLLRSEAMQHAMLVLPVQEARKFINIIGRETRIQFEDMNAHEMRRPYRRPIQRIDDLERILRFMYDEIAKVDGCELTTARVDEFLGGEEVYTLDQVEAELSKCYKQIVNFSQNNVGLTTERNHAVEEREVMKVAMEVLGAPSTWELNASMSAADDNFQVSARRPMLAGDVSTGLGYLAGVVSVADEKIFSRALWRASRGNAFVQFRPIAELVFDPKTGANIPKSVFVVYFQGSSSMQTKLTKVCQAFGVNMYNWPGNSALANGRFNVLAKVVNEKDRTLLAFKAFMKKEMEELLAPVVHKGGVEGNSKIEEWRLFCIKEKSIYSVLNLCSGDLLLQVNVWYPAAQEAEILATIAQANQGMTQGAFLNKDKSAFKGQPPTYIRTNDFTDGWQMVVNTYGIPYYQEANPGLLTVVTFPFIFGMMYGDVGHGTLLMLAGLYLIKNAERFRYTVPVLFLARFMIFQLGCFAIFAGFMYNDFFSVGLKLFESGFKDPGNGFWEPITDTKNEGGVGPYVFGVDWAWHGASNELLFVNSLKMKLSVLFGVLQMIVGVGLKFSNAIYEKNTTDLLCECVPMLMFMVCFFGWMDFMVLYKWTNPIDSAPSIINSLICMAMGQEDKAPLYDGSVALSKNLMLLTVCSVPWMLIPKPILLKIQHGKKMKQAKEQGHLLDVEIADGGHGEHGEEFDFSEIVIHQVIEVIEYVLGTVSHTASYLRIWALSLAHQQLSLVFFQKTIAFGLAVPAPFNGIALYISFTVWFAITLAVLMGMDVLECFLHTLRLHWVEFQSKFYKGGGLEFEPYDIRKLVEPKED